MEGFPCEFGPTTEKDQLRELEEEGALRRKFAVSNGGGGGTKRQLDDMDGSGDRDAVPFLLFCCGLS